MLARIPMKGTILNAILVAIGALVGLAIGKIIPLNIRDMVIPAIGLCNIAFAVKMFLKGEDTLLIIVSVVIGGILGLLMKIDVGMVNFAEWARHTVGGTGTFNEGLITTSVLYCVGPMTLIGCMKDGLSGDIELLKIKSILDGIAAVFFAAALGSGVVVTAAVVLVFQGALTLAARLLEPLTRVPGAIDEMTAVGGVMMLAIGLGLAGIKHFPVEIFIPSLFLAPAGVVAKRKWAARFGANPEPAQP